MRLFEKMMTECCLMTMERTPDSAGGFNTAWTEGTKLKAAIIRDTSTQGKIAERSGVTSIYTITTAKRVTLKYHDVIKRLSDGKIFRVTSDPGDKEAPEASTLDIAQVTAEKWELTT